MPTVKNLNASKAGAGWSCNVADPTISGQGQLPPIKAAFVIEGRFAFSFKSYLLPVAVCGVGAGVDWFGLARLAEVSTIVRAFW
jgi:hypothetical protein